MCAAGGVKHSGSRETTTVRDVGSLVGEGGRVSAGNGKSVIQHPGGGLVQVPGVDTVGTHYLVLDSKLDGEAQALVNLEIEIEV